MKTEIDKLNDKYVSIVIEIISITMLTYLSLSLSISVFMNWYNKKMAIKEK